MATNPLVGRFYESLCWGVVNVKKSSWVFSWLLVSSPAWLMLSLVLQGSETQFGDYFGMLGQLFDSDGFVPLGLLEHQNEHLVTIPKIIYLVNILLFDGSNISLGVFVWLSALATVFLLLLALEELHPRRSFLKYSLRFATFLLVFPVAAIHNFVYSMSGTAWILSNLFSVLAVSLAARGKTIPAAISALAATLSYGTGLAAWPALAVVLILKRKWGFSQFLALIIGFAAVIFERGSSSPVPHHPQLASNPLEVLRQLLIYSGSILSNDIELSLLFGFVLVTVFFVGVSQAIGSKELGWHQLAAFGVGTFALISILLFSISRLGFGGGIAPSRYMTLIGLLTLSSLFLFSAFQIKKTVKVVGTLAVLIFTGTSSVSALSGYEQRVAELNLNAIEMRMDSAEGQVFGYRTGTSEILSSLSHFPFNKSGDSFFCDVLSREISVTTGFESNRIRGYFDGLEESDENLDTFRAYGWLYPSDVECLLIVDKHSRVVGAAVPGFKRADVSKALEVAEDLGWRAVVFSDSVSPLSLVVRLHGSDEFVFVDALD